MWSRGHLIKLCVVAALLINEAGACGKKGKKEPDNPDNGNKPPPDNGNKPPPANNDPLKDLGVQAKPMDNSGYDGKNGKADSPDDLKCDFEKPCCWKNTKPPYDTMEWLQVSGSPPPDKMQAAFGTSTPPSGNWMATGSQNAAGPADKAEFESCVIPCAGDQIKVTLKHWLTQGVKLQACEVAKADPNTLLGCQEFPSASPGPDSVQLPPGSDLIISIVASNFVSDKGGLAMVDDIVVEYPPCGGSSPAATTTTPAGATPGPAPTEGPTQPPPPSNDGLKQICCGFDSGPCSYQPKVLKRDKKNRNTRAAGGKGWEKCGPERFHNPATGVPPSPDKAAFCTYLMPKDASSMSAPCESSQDFIVKFQEYKATQDCNLQCCCDENCSYDTGGKVEKGDFRQWYQGSVQCPAGTKSVSFRSSNKGVNEGGVGVDQIQVFDTAGNQIC